MPNKKKAINIAFNAVFIIGCAAAIAGFKSNYSASKVGVALSITLAIALVIADLRHGGVIKKEIQERKRNTIPMTVLSLFIYYSFWEDFSFRLMNEALGKPESYIGEIELSQRKSFSSRACRYAIHIAEPSKNANGRLCINRSKYDHFLYEIDLATGKRTALISIKQSLLGTSIKDISK